MLEMLGYLGAMFVGVITLRYPVHEGIVKYHAAVIGLCLGAS